QGVETSAPNAAIDHLMTQSAGSGCSRGHVTRALALESAFIRPIEKRLFIPTQILGNDRRHAWKPLIHWNRRSRSPKPFLFQVGLVVLQPCEGSIPAARTDPSSNA